MNVNELQELQENAGLAVALLKRMAHKDRLLILCHLTTGEITAGELSRRSLLSQSAFSQHLAVLRAEQLVKTRKEAQTIYYSLANDAVIEVLSTLKQIFCK
ncbi:MAG: transcriptional regulator [Neisseriales bacterium]|nr:MAG: transcriptional regulator [Neisseriales bacterium]